MNVMEVKNVSYNYVGNAKKVLKNISMYFETGKMYGIIGKSGSGKSTLLSLLAGLETCKEGEVIYGGENLNDIDRDDYRAKKIGMVFQGYNLLTNATALENVILAMDISGVKGKRKEKAYELLERVGIDANTAQRKILKLSGGEQQRVGIACAISYDADVILADEPTGNLDRENERTILELFAKLAKEQGKCVVIVTHSKVIENYVDELYGMNNGQIHFLT